MADPCPHPDVFRGERCPKCGRVASLCLVCEAPLVTRAEELMDDKPLTPAEFDAWFEARHARYLAELDAEVSRHCAEERRIEREYRRDLERATLPMMDAAIVRPTRGKEG